LLYWLAAAISIKAKDREEWDSTRAALYGIERVVSTQRVYGTFEPHFEAVQES
jgi:hypothetical protein